MVLLGTGDGGGVSFFLRASDLSASSRPTSSWRLVEAAVEVEG